MARTTQEGAAALKIMKIPLQPGAAQQDEAVLFLHKGVDGKRFTSHLAAVVAEQKAEDCSDKVFRYVHRQNNTQWDFCLSEGVEIKITDLDVRNWSNSRLNYCTPDTLLEM